MHYQKLFHYLYQILQLSYKYLGYFKKNYLNDAF